MFISNQRRKVPALNETREVRSGSAQVVKSRVPAFLLAACAMLAMSAVAAADEDDRPYLGVNSPSVQEGDSGTTTLTFTARLTDAKGRTKASDKTITANYRVLSESGDTAAAGKDYQATSGTLTFAPGETSKTIDVSVLGDTEVEGDETLTLKWVTPWTNVLLVRYTHTGTIRDDDGVSVPVIPAALSIADASAEEGDSLSFTVTLDQAVSGGLTVTPSFTDGTATKGADYTPNAAALTFAGTAGETRSFSVSTTEDTDVEGDETFTVGLSVSGTTHNVNATDTATGTITNDDEETPWSEDRPYLSANSPSVQEGNSGTTTLTFTARLTDANGRTQASTETITANYRVLSESGDSAAAGKDYTAASGTVTFAPGETSKTIDVSVLGDTEAEGDETLTLKWVAPWTNVLLASYTATGTITDDDETDEVRAANFGTLSVTANVSGINEKDSGRTVTVEVSAPPAIHDIEVTVQVGYSSDSATEGTDYNTVADFTVTVPGLGYRNYVDGTFTLTPKQDSYYEGNETIKIGVSADDTTPNSTTITLTDDDIKLTASVTGVHEGGPARTVTVTATAASTHSAKRGMGVYIGGSGDDATEGTDYANVVEHTINIQANQTTASASFTLSPIQDTTVEGDESLSITGWVATDKWSVVGTHIVIYDDDYSLSVNPSSFDEDAGTRQVTVTACCGTAAGARSVRVKVGKSGDSFVEGTDYDTVRDFDIAIAQDATNGTGTFNLALQDNGVYGTPTRTITLSGTSLHGSVAGTSISIHDDDADPAVTLELNVTSTSEAGGAKTVKLTATNTLDTWDTSWEADVSVGKSGDSATEGTDYETVADFTIRSANPGDPRASRTFTLTPTNDAAIEGTERISVTGTTLLGNTKVRSAFLNLTDDDATSIALSANKSSVSEGASATTVTVTATAAKDLSAASAITVYVGDSGSADYGIDYAKVSDFTINIASGSKTGTGTFTLTPTDDSAVEGDETIGISGSVTGHSLTGTSLTLSENDTHAITLSASPTSVAEDASATSVTVTATAGAAFSSARTVTVAVGGSGTATSGTDYAAVSNFDITIAANATSGTGTFTLTPTDDSSVEGDETIGIAGSGTSLTVTGTSLTLSEDDTHAITLSASPTSVAEDVATAPTVTVTATAGSAISSARTVSVVVGGSSDGATEGTDYSTVNDFTITIAADATSGTGTFTLTPTQDTLVEGDETISVSGSGTLMTVTGTSLTLSDDDVRTISLSASETTVSEGAGATTVTVTATANSAVSEATTVTVAVGASGDGATEGTDYTTVADFDVTIAKDATSGTGTFTLTPTDDTTYEGEESVSLSGSSSPHTVTGTSLAIGNNDGISISLSVSPTSVVEGGGATSVTVTATAAQTALAAITVDVQVGKSTDSATEGTDYPTVNDFTLTIAKDSKKGTATFKIIPNSDKKDSEKAETISIDGSSSPHTVTGTSLTLTNATASNPITLSVSPSSLGEAAGETTVTVTARMQTSFKGKGDVTVTVGTSGSAKSGTDYGAVSDIELSFSAEQPTTATGTFKLTPTDDAVVENNETVWVDGTSDYGQVVGASVTINDNDGSAVALSVNKTSVSEGASATSVTVTATASAASSNARTVTVSVGRNGDGAIEGTDYTEVSDFSITIAANKTSGTGTFTLTPTQDTVVEGSESLTISGSGSQLNVSSTSISLTDDDTAPKVNLSVSPTSVTEGASDPLNLLGGGKTVTVTAAFSTTKTYASDQTVAVSVGGSGTATSGSDYDAVSNFNVKISAGQTSGTATFDLKSTDDSVLEGSETIGVAGTATGLTVNSATLTLADNDSAAVTVNDASAAEGSSMTFTVTLDKEVQGGLTVTPSYTNGTAASGDYTANTTGIAFSGNANETQTFTVSTTQDDVVEGNETFTVGLSVSKAPSGVTSTDTGTGTINSATESNVDTATLTIDDASASEGEGISFTVTLDEAVQGGLTVTPSYTNGTAASGDYTANTTGITFSGTKGETETFTVSTKDDAVLEGDETFTVGLTVSGTTLSDRITATDTGTGTIDNDDSAAVTIADADADEGDGISFTVTLDTAVQGGLKVTPGYTNGTAASTDYTTNTEALTFTGTADETQSFTVSTKDDAVLEGDETFTVDLTVSGTSLSITASDTATGTIDNDDSADVTIADANADEGNNISFTVTLDTAVQGGLKVTPGFTDGTAVEGTDYDENTNALTFTGNANETQSFTVSTTEDDSVEDAETFTVDLTVSGTALSITSTDTGTGTINNDDGATVTVNNASASEGDSLTFTVTLGDAVQGGLTVTPGFTDGTAVEGTDYDENTTALSFTGTANETKTFTVSTTEDAVLEGNETFTVGLTVSGAPSGITDTDTGTGTINNDDSAAVTVNDASADEGESISFTVTLDTAVQGGLTVTPSFTDGTAVEGTDYDENTNALTFTGTADETKTITVKTTEDAVFEANETFTVDLTVSGTTLSITTTDTGAGTINNDESAAVTVNDASASEGEGLTFTVTLDTAVQGGLTVTPGFTDGTAVEGTDYDENTTALNFTGTKGETKEFTVSSTEDAVLEGNETFTVGLAVSNAPSGVTSTDTGAGTINNDDSATVTVNDADADEGNGVTFTVTLDTAVQGGLKVTPGFTDGTAVEGTDYDENTTALTFTGTANEMKTFTVSTNEDAVLEADETFTVGLSVSDAPSGVTSTDTGTGTINNDDGAIVTIADADADEGQSITFTVTLGDAVQGGLTVTPGFTNGTAASTDYTENTAPLNFEGKDDETRTFTVSTTADTMLEVDETFTVDLTVSGTSLSVDDTDTGTGTINDNDSAALTINDASADEGGDLTFTVTLDQQVQGSVTVTPSYTNGTAASTDYTANTTPLKFSGPIQAQTFTVSTVQDESVEEDETFTVGLTVSGTSLDITATDTGTGTIKNDDYATSETKGVELSVSPSSVSEGAGATNVKVTATLPEGVTLPVATVIAIRVTGGTATVGDDFEAVSDFQVTIPADAQSGTGTFTLTPVLDARAESDETVLIQGSSESLPVGSTELLITDEINEVELSVSPSHLGEDAGATTVTVTATLPEGVTFSAATGITIQVTGGTATAGDDFEAVSDFQVTIPADAQAGTGTFTMTPIVDTEEEPDETVLIDGSSEGLSVASTELVIAANENEDPFFVKPQAREVAENTPSGEAVGEPVTASDRDRDELEYSLSGTDAESFAIDSDTGQLRTLATLDYETVSSYQVTVEVTDGRDADGEEDPEVDDTVDVTINVIDVDEAPEAPDAPAVQRADTSVLSVTWTAPEDNGGPPVTDYDLEYRAAESDDPYRDAGYDGTATSAQISGVQAKVTYEVRVRASNDEGTSPWSEPGREARSQNQAPVAVDDLVHVNRGEETRSLVGHETGGVSANQESRLTAPDRTNNVLANDSDAEDDVSELQAELVTAPSHGDLRLDPRGTFSYRHDGSRSTEDAFTYRAQDSDGAYSNEATVRIVVFSTNSGPVAVGTIPDQRLKMGQEGAVEVDGYFEDPDGDPLSYSVRSWDVETVTAALTGSRVGLNPVRVAVTRVTVTASDPEGLSAEQTFQVEVEMLADPEQVLELSLAALGRTVASQAVDTISERFKNRTRGMQATFGGQQLGTGTGSDPNQSAAAGLAGVAGRSVAGGLSGPAGLAGAAGLSGPGGHNPVMDLLRNPAGGPGRPVMEPISLPSVGSGITAGMAGLGGAEVFSRSDGDRIQGSSFDLTLDSDGDGDKNQGWALWGRGVGSFLSGMALGDSSLDGQVGAVYVGADHYWGSKVVLGAAVSHSRGTLDYSDIGGGSARLGANLTAVHPYVHWSPREGLGLWGMMGLGRGTADLDLGDDRKELGIDLRMAAFGGRNELAQVGGVDLALKGDAFAASVGSEAVSGLRSVRGDTRRTRLMLEGSRTLQVSPESRLTPSVEVGVRLDGGDAETGAGMEMAGSLSYLHQPTGLSVEARGHWLAAHQAQDFRERGFGVTVRLDPGADGTGLSLQVSPAWGAQNSGAGTMWNHQGMMGGGSAAGRGEELGWLPGWTQGEVGYGMRTWGGRGLLTPFGRLDSQGPGSLRMGGGLRLALPTFLGGGGQSLIASMAKGLSLELIGLYEPSGSGANPGSTSDAGTAGPFGAAASLFLNF